MKKTYSIPKLLAHGTVQQLTQIKKLGSDDALALVIPVLSGEFDPDHFCTC